jgi:hypothetical protein
MTINSLYNAKAFGSILASLDNLGLNLALVTRQTSRVFGPLIGQLAKQIRSGEPSKDLKDFAKNWEALMKGTGFADPNSEISVADNVVSMKVINCMYLSMAAFGKSHGYAACPVCILNLGIASLIHNWGTGTVVERSEKNSENICLTKMVID